MGNSLGKDDKKKGPQVNKANSYPQTKRGRRSTDGTPPHLNLETSSKEKSSKYGTGTFSKDIKLQQQLAEVRLGETIGKEKRNSVQERSSRKSAPQSENGRNESEPNKKDGSMRKRGSKLGFLHSSLKRGKSPSVPLNSTSTAPVAEVPKVPSSPSISSSSISPSSVSPSPASISPSSMSPPSSPHGTQELGNSKPVSSLSEESDYMSSSVSSLEVGSKDSFFLARENSYQSYTTGFVDPDNVVGYSDPILKSAAYRPRGRSLSDSYKSNDSSRENSFTELQRAAENDMKKNRRFQELSKVLSERNNIIIDLLDLTFVRKIGEGAFSEVWEGYWNGVHVAIKRLKSMVNDELFQERFLREVESLRKGNHQNIVMCFGVCLNPACIITEYMAGGNLYDLLHKTGCRMSTGLVVKLALDLALGLLHLHSLGILHRDLTSLNVLLDDIGNIKISDFGLSREKSQEGSMTMTLGGICNPRWRPPEITKNIGHYSEKVDVYSFALVVWEILTGELPYANLDGPQAAAQVAYTNLRPIIPTSCPTPLRDLLQRCWADDAKLRPDFKEIVDELKSIQFHNPMALSSELR